VPNEHIFNNLAFNSESEICHVRNCFEVMAFKGEEVTTNQVKITKSKRLSLAQQSIIKYIVCSDNQNPKVIEKDKTEKLGQIKFDFGKSNVNDMVIHTEFYFGDTMLKVFVFPANKPYMRKEVELSYD